MNETVKSELVYHEIVKIEDVSNIIINVQEKYNGELLSHKLFNVHSVWYVELAIFKIINN